MNHRVIIESEPGGYRAICACRARSLFSAERDDAEDWRFHHLELASRVRTHLAHGRAPSLASQRDYFRAMATDLNTPAVDRPLWKQLADELDHRLGPDTGVYKDAGLW